MRFTRHVYVHSSTLCFVSIVPVFTLSANVTEGVDSSEMKSPEKANDDRTDGKGTAAAADAGDDAGYFFPRERGSKAMWPRRRNGLGPLSPQLSLGERTDRGHVIIQCLVRLRSGYGSP